MIYELPFKVVRSNGTDEVLDRAMAERLLSSFIVGAALLFAYAAPCRHISRPRNV
jgi:hypothetical protein